MLIDILFSNSNSSKIVYKLYFKLIVSQKIICSVTEIEPKLFKVYKINGKKQWGFSNKMKKVVKSWNSYCIRTCQWGAEILQEFDSTPSSDYGALGWSQMKIKGFCHLHFWMLEGAKEKFVGIFARIGILNCRRMIRTPTLKVNNRLGY